MDRTLPTSDGAAWRFHEYLLRFLGCGLILYVPLLILAYLFPNAAMVQAVYTPGVAGIAVVLGAAGAWAWTRFEATLETDAVHFAIQVVVRFFLAYIFTTYAFAKFYRSQLYDPLLQWQAVPLGGLGGFELTWAFFGTSYEYVIFIGLLQLVCAVLLLFARTQLLGALLLLPIIGNIVVLNFAYDIPVKIPSCVYLAMAGYLVLIDFRRLKTLLWDHRSMPPRSIASLGLSTGIRYGATVAVGVLILGVTFWEMERFKADYPVKESDVTGVWDVTDYTANGETVFRRQSSGEAWTTMIFEKQFGGTQAVVESGDRRLNAEFEIYPDERRLEIYGRGFTFFGTYRLLTDEAMVLDGVRGDDSVRVELTRRTPAH